MKARVPAEPLPVAVARAVFLLIVAFVGTVVVSIVLLSWQALVIGLGVTLVAFGYLILEANQAAKPPKS